MFLVHFSVSNNNELTIMPMLPLNFVFLLISFTYILTCSNPPSKLFFLQDPHNLDFSVDIWMYNEFEVIRENKNTKENLKATSTNIFKNNITLIAFQLSYNQGTFRRNSKSFLILCNTSPRRFGPLPRRRFSTLDSAGRGRCARGALGQRIIES